MENFYHNLTMDIANCFAHLENNDNVKKKYGNIASLIRIHDKNFAEGGEVSFPCALNLWEKYFPNATISTDAFEHIKGANCKHFLAQETSKWLFPVSRLDIRKERCHLYLERKSVMGKLIQQVLNDADYGRLKKTEDSKVYIKPLENYGLNDQDLSYHRVKLVHQTLQKLIIFTKYATVDDHKSSDIVIEVTSAMCCIPEDNKSDADVKLKCGPVIYPSTPKEETCHLTPEQYLRCRSEHVRKMALFRSRKVVQNEPCFNDLMDQLGGADVIVSLLEVKHTNAVQIRTVGNGGTKGALFLLYNSARLETLLRTFEERIKYSDYDQQPEMKDIDWSILNEDEEWQLVFTYIAGFPDLIDRCVEHLERGVFAVHLIIHFLNGLVSLFSKYYIRIRILTEKRDHLMPYVYARIYLLQAIREIFNRTLGFLGIKPVESM